MNPTEFVFKNLILKVRTGSHLYGTSTPASDEDFVGICVPPKDYVIGLYNFEQYADNTKKSNESRRNNKEDRDFTIHSLKKYVALAKDNNPNILELLFVKDNNIEFINDIGKDLLAHKHLFPSQKSYYTMKGYAFSQKQKLITKRERLEDFRNALMEVNDLAPSTLSERLVVGTGKNHWKTYEAGTDVNVVKNDIETILSEYGQRIDYIIKYGYDVKFASHLIRLLFEAKEILSTGELSFPLHDRQEILHVKQGFYTLEEVLKRSDELEKEVDLAFANTKLPHTSDLKTINDYLVDALSNFWAKEEVVNKR